MRMSMNIIREGISGFTTTKEADVVLATHITHAMVGSVTGDRIYLHTNLGKLYPDGMFMCIAYSGVAKSIPLLNAVRIARRLGIVCPSKFTTESLSAWFYEKVKESYTHPNYGIIFWDEASKMFSESKRKEFMDGAIEAMSMLHNHYIPPEFYKTSQYGICQDPYVSMIANMVPQYLPNVPEYFWNQGIAGRILWRYIPPQPPNAICSWNDFSISDVANKNRELFDRHLEVLKDTLHSSEPVRVVLDDEANKLVAQFKYDIETEWYEAIQVHPYEINFSYKKRLTELLGKTALRIAISNYFEENEELTGMRYVTASDVNEALSIVKQSNADLEFCFNFINQQPKNKEDMHDTSKLNYIYNQIKLGKDTNYIRSSSESYASKLSFEDCIRRLLNARRIQPIGTKGTGTIQYEVKE